MVIELLQFCLGAYVLHVLSIYLLNSIIKAYGACCKTTMVQMFDVGSHTVVWPLYVGQLDINNMLAERYSSLQHFFYIYKVIYYPFLTSNDPNKLQTFDNLSTI